MREQLLITSFIPLILNPNLFQVPRDRTNEKIRVRRRGRKAPQDDTTRLNRALASNSFLQNIRIRFGKMVLPSQVPRRGIRRHFDQYIWPINISETWP